MERADQPTQPILSREDRGSVLILTLNRPDKLNALNNEVISAIMNVLDSIELDRTIRAIVITGAGRAFSAGADIAAFQPHIQAGAAEAVANFMRPGHRMTRRVESFSKPIIAAVNGLAFGGGCELVESTHIALAAETATFSKAEINIGIIPTFGGTQRLPRNVGRKAAIELLFQRRHTPVGIVHGSVPPHVTLLEESVVPDRAGNLVIQDALKPGGQLPRVLAGELIEAAMSFQKSLLDDVGGVHTHGDPPIELSFSQAVQIRPLRLQQVPQRFSIALPGLLQQRIREIGFLHRRTPKNGRDCKSFGVLVQLTTCDRPRQRSKE